MVYRIYVEKKPGLEAEAKALLGDAKHLLGIERLENVRIFNRYDAENISEELFNSAVNTVFSEPQVDNASKEIDLSGATVFATEYLPGQFDQRADSAAQCIQIISQGDRPTIRTFKGCLYFGLMLTPKGPKVIEYNCRFGDPETQVVLPLLKSDLLTVMQATTNGTLADTEVKFADKNACCVILASKGYPVSYEKGFPMTMTDEAKAHTFVAGAKLEDGVLKTNGGRVTGTTAIADTLEDAIREAYRISDGVHFDNSYRRSDIGQRALQALK